MRARYGISVVAGIALMFITTAGSHAATDFDFNEIKVGADIPQTESHFGTTVAIDGNVAVVGVPGWNLRTYINSGAVYIFEYCDGSWTQVRKLICPDPDYAASFGSSVDISGNTVIVGTPEPPPYTSWPLRAYVFERNQGGSDMWGLSTYIAPATPMWNSSRFGTSVAISGNTIVVGAPNGNSTELGGYGIGAAYVFERNEGGPENWGERQVLSLGSGAVANFGDSVSISGNIIVIGEPDHNDSSAGYPSVLDVGAAYVFERNQGGPDNWGLVKQLMAGDAGAQAGFGNSVAIHNNTVVIGSHDPAESTLGAGAVYVFQREEGGVENWGQVKKLTPSDGPIGNGFGWWSVSIDGNWTVVGAPNDEYPGEFTAAGPNAGAVYLFGRNEGGINNWGEVQKIVPSDRYTGDLFGAAVDISGGWMLSGTPHDNYGLESDSGSVYFFD